MTENQFSPAVQEETKSFLDYISHSDRITSFDGILSKLKNTMCNAPLIDGKTTFTFYYPNYLALFRFALVFTSLFFFCHSYSATRVKHGKLGGKYSSASECLRMNQLKGKMGVKQ